MEKQDLLYKVALTMIPDVGAITAKKLIAYTGAPEAVFREKPAHLEKIPGIGKHLSGRITPGHILERAEEEIRRMEKHRIGVLYYQDPDYPWRLKNCEDGPVLLFHYGEPDFNRSRILSIVGTRSATSYGKSVCENIIAGLASRHPDLIILSGLAYGIDITAHRAALDYGLCTVGVLAHGLTTIYPLSHGGTARKMVRQGALVTDFHSDKQPERNNFLRRNRIIAGMADATLVVESARKGGALITAGLASSYNRDVLAVPGRSEDTYSAGCNQLIKQNIAALTESARDIEYILNWEQQQEEKEHTPTIHGPLTEEERTILETILSEPMIGPDVLSVRTAIPMHKLLALLVQMELQDWIMIFPGNQYKARVIPEMTQKKSS